MLAIIGGLVQERRNSAAITQLNYVTLVLMHRYQGLFKRSGLGIFISHKSQYHMYLWFYTRMTFKRQHWGHHEWVITSHRNQWMWLLIHALICNHELFIVHKLILMIPFLIARFTGPTWGTSRAGRTEVGPILAPWALLSGLKKYSSYHIKGICLLFPIDIVWYAHLIYEW